MKNKLQSLIKFIIGIIFILISTILMFLGNQDIPISIQIIILVVGIALIETSKYRLLK